MARINHQWTLDDRAYFYDNSGKVLISVGALSYIMDMEILDYTSSMPPGQEQGQINIGRATSIGSGVIAHLYGKHDHSRITSSPLMPLVVPNKILPPEPQQVTIIGNDVWIANGVRILGGVTIGNGAVVGADSLVNSDIPPYAVAVGTPARVIKYRFTPEQIAKLEAIAWWEWPLDKIQQYGTKLLSFDIDDFINEHYPPVSG